MKLRYNIAALAAALTLGSATNAALADTRIALVDRDAVLCSMPQYRIVELRLDQISKSYQEEYERLSADIDRKFEDYQLLNTQSTAVPQSIRERRIQEIQNMQKHAQQFLLTAENDLKAQQTEMHEPLVDKVNEAIRQAALEGNYTLVLPLGQPLYYSIEVDDITERVKDIIRQSTRP